MDGRTDGIFSSAYFRILISLVAMDLDANQYQRCVPLEAHASSSIVSVAAGRSLPPLPTSSHPSQPTTFRPGGKHLPLCCIHIMTSNHYGAVMSWPLSAAASLELPSPSGPLVLFRPPQPQVRGRELCRQQFHCGGWNSASRQGY